MRNKRFHRTLFITIFSAIAGMFFFLEQASAEENLQPLTVTELLKSVKDEYNTISTMKADFRQITYQAMLQESSEEKGQVFLKKPDKMKWLYQGPSEKIALLNEVRVWMYIAEDNHLYSESAGAYSENLFYQLISGTIDFEKTFLVTLVKDQNTVDSAKLFVFSLEPIQTHPTMQKIEVTFGRDPFLIQKTIVFDHFGNTTTCSFYAFQVNKELKDEIFTIGVPADVTITDFQGSVLEKDLLMKHKEVISIEKAQKQEIDQGSLQK